MAPYMANKASRALVDVKPAYLEEGQYPCRPGLHLDVLPTAAPASQDRHLLIVFGNNALTRFYQGPLDPHHTPRQLRKLSSTSHIPEGTLVTYNNYGLHEGVAAKYSGPRLLIRITETDSAVPRRNKGTHTLTAAKLDLQS